MMKVTLQDSFYPLPISVLRRLPEPPPAAGLGREPDTASQSSPHSSASSVVTLPRATN